MFSAAFQLAVLGAGLAALMLLVVRGKSIFVVAPLCAAATAAVSGADPVATMTGPYMTGFADYVRNFYLVFVLGAAFGKLYEDSGAAATIADRVSGWLGRRRACLAVVLACAVLTYGGVSLFVVGFSVHPLAVRLFRAADLPRRFIPAAIAFGSITFTMTSAGSPEIQNLIPIKYLVDEVTRQPLTDALAGWPASLIVGAVMFAAGQAYLDRAIGRAVAAGEHWEDRPRDGADELPAGRKRPGLLAACGPLIATLAALNAAPVVGRWIAAAWPVGVEPHWLHARLHAICGNIPEDPAFSIFLGVVTAVIGFRRHVTSGWACLGEGFMNGLLAIGATSSVVAFGAVLKGLPAFQQIVSWVTSMPGDPLLAAAVAVALISAVAGSASGGQGIALPIIKPIFVDTLGVAPRALHRVVAISSGTLDSLPSSGYLVMLIRTICGETHEQAYRPIFVTTVLIPLLGTGLAIALFKLVPAWGQM